MSSYSLELSERFKKEFKKLDTYTQKILRGWIEKHLNNTADPRAFGKGLTGNRNGHWRYRIGDYRLICMIDDNKLIILALTVGHRRDIYKR